MNISDLISLIGLTGLALTGVGLLLARRQLKASYRQAQVSQRIASGQFLLQLDEMFWHHDKTHRRLRPGGEWTKPGAGPSSHDDWVDVELYMGLFERIQVLEERGILQADTVDRLYGYRISNIIRNAKIRKRKLGDTRTRLGWKGFIALATKIDRYTIDDPPANTPPT